MITQKLVNLCNAMTEAEGWKPNGNFEKPAKFPSVSYRNNNPGNLRISPFALGVRDNFAFFLNSNIGMFAMNWDIMKKCKGETQTTLTGDSALCDLLKIYNCAEGEEFNNYLKIVCDRTGLEAFSQLKDIIK